MEKEIEKATEIPQELLEKTVKKYLNNFKLFSRNGMKLALINAGAWQTSKGLLKGEATALNVVTLIELEIMKKTGIDPKSQKNLYRATRMQIRKEVCDFIKRNPSLNSKLNKMKKMLLLRASERIGSSFLSTAIHNSNKTRRKLFRKK